MSSQRSINFCLHHFTKDRKCIRCGSFKPTASEPLKTKKYSTPFHFNLTTYLKCIRKNQTAVIQPKALGEDTIQLLASICEKFTFTDQTLALGLYIYQCLNKLNANQKFWASACLIIAGKAGELDKNVPYLNRYQRYADKCFSQQEYEQAERTIFEGMNFQVQHSTFITFLQFYLTCGVIFSTDSLNESLVEFLQDDLVSRAKEFLRTGTFTRYQPELLVLSIVKETRLKYHLKGWCQELKELSGYAEEEVISVGQQSPLKEISCNASEKIDRMIQINSIVGVFPRKKYERTERQERSDKYEFSQLFKVEKAPVSNYVSSSRPMVALKENAFGGKGVGHHVPNKKAVQNLFGTEAFASVSADLLKRR